MAVIRGREAGLVREHNDRAWAAYQTAMLPRMKRPPTLRRLQIRDRSQPQKKQSWQQMKAVAHMITMINGGEVVRKDEGG